MQLTLGPIEQDKERFPGDTLAFHHADLLDPQGNKVGTVHTNGYAPRWAYQITPFRWKYLHLPQVRDASSYEPGSLQRLLFDGGAAHDSAEIARATAQEQLTAFLAKLAESQAATV